MEVGRGRAGGRDVQEGVGILELEMLRGFGNGENWMWGRCWRTVRALWQTLRWENWQVSF